MALSRAQLVATYASTQGAATYLFDLVVGQNGVVSARNIRGPRGLVNDPATEIPQGVLDDIVVAKGLVNQAFVETTVYGQSVNFTGQTYKDVAIPADILNNTDYRVVFDTVDDMPLVVENATTTSFRIVAASTYGTPLAPKAVGWTVLVAAQQASATSGTVTITDADASHKAVTFVTAMLTKDYRVVLSPNGFFPVYVAGKTKGGFTIYVGYTLALGETITVGYDVFV